MGVPPQTDIMRLLLHLLILLTTLPIMLTVNTAIFKRYTAAGKGCTCWFDIRRKDCACCKGKASKVMQCGWPMHHYCYKKSERFGCPGIPNNKYTFSTRGYPCFWDHDRTDCAWCSPGGYQCGPGQKAGPEAKDGNRCQTGRNLKYCDSVLGDCGISQPVTTMPSVSSTESLARTSTCSTASATRRGATRGTVFSVLTGMEPFLTMTHSP